MKGIKKNKSDKITKTEKNLKDINLEIYISEEDEKILDKYKEISPYTKGLVTP